MARDFDGSADYLNTATLPLVGTSYFDYPFTFSCWALVDSYATTGTLFWLGNTSSSLQGARLQINQTTGTLVAYVRNAAGNTRAWTTTAAVGGSSWVNLIGVFTSPTDFKAYINNNSTGSYTNSNTTVLTSTFINIFTVGARAYTSVGLTFNGKLAELGIWQSALSESERQMLTDGYAPIAVAPSNLTGYYPLFGRNGAAGDEESWAGVGGTLEQTSSPGVVGHPRIIYPRRRSDIWVPPSAGGPPTLSASTYVPGSRTSTGWRPRVTAAY